ncbi:hypothetical protein D9M70_647480 [compost metagenome]
MVEPAQLRLVHIDAGCPIAHEGIVVPTVPEPLYGVEIFVGDFVAQLVLWMLAPVVAARTFKR